MGEAATSQGYRLEPVGEYLGLVELCAEESYAEGEEAEGSPSTAAIPGELFEVSEELLTVLDEFEGDTYLRGHVRLAPGSPNEPNEPADKERFHGIALAYFKKAR